MVIKASLLVAINDHQRILAKPGFCIYHSYIRLEGFRVLLMVPLDGTCLLCRLVVELCRNMVWRLINGGFALCRTHFLLITNGFKKNYIVSLR